MACASGRPGPPGAGRGLRAASPRPGPGWRGLPGPAPAWGGVRGRRRPRGAGGRARAGGGWFGARWGGRGPETEAAGGEEGPEGPAAGELDRETVMRVSRLATSLACSNTEARARLESLFKLLPHMRRRHEQLCIEEMAQLLEESSLKNLGSNLVRLKVLFPSLDVGRMVAGSEGLLAGPFEEVEAKLRKELALLELAELADLEPLMQDYPEALDCILDEGELLLTDFWAVYQTDKDVRWRRESKLRAI